MSMITRAFKRIAAEVAYHTGNEATATRLVTAIAAEQATQAITKASRNGIVESNSEHIEFFALDRGVRKYDTVRADFESQIKPAVYAAAAKGIMVELEGGDAWCSLAHCGPASVRVKLVPTKTFG